MQLGYADTKTGPIHYRRDGSGFPLILLHWAPASGRMYKATFATFAAQGFQSIALDMPGYGRSHKNCRGWSIPQIAENLLESLDTLGIDSAHLVGGHLSASIATEMAVQNPGTIKRLVLDGVLLLEPDEWTGLLKGFAGLSPRIGPDESFKAFPFDMVIQTLSEWNPDFQLTEDSLHQVYDLMNDYLEMGLTQMRAFIEPDSGPKPAPYPLAAQLGKLTQPTLILTAEKDPLNPGYQRALDTVPDSVGHNFKGVHPLPSEGQKEYAETIAAFLLGSTNSQPG